MLWNKEKTEDVDFLDEIEIERSARIRVRVTSQFHQYKRGDDLIVEDSPFTQALIDNGTFIEVEDS